MPVSAGRLRSILATKGTSMPQYDVIEDFYIDAAGKNVAETARQVACLKLGIQEPPDLWWIIDARFGAHWFENDVNGWTSKDGGTIFVHKDCSPFGIASVVAHECRHVWQIRNPKWFPIPNRNFSRGLSREQRERDAEIFELEFWDGAEKRSGDVAEISRILTAMEIHQAIKASIRSAAVPTKHGLVFSASYPRQGQTRVIVPSEKEMEESLLNQILN